MPTNDFIGFASAGSANIMSQADYAAAAEQTDGVQPGPASSALANKIWRQGANMAAALGGIISDQGFNALDNGDIDALKASLRSALWDVGTWTPYLYGGTTTGSFTYTTQSGMYLKIGPICYVTFQIDDATVVTAPSGACYIGGQPFSCSLLSQGGTLTVSSFPSGAFANTPTHIRFNTSTIGIWEIRSNRTLNYTSFGTLSPGDKISFRGSGWYSY